MRLLALLLAMVAPHALIARAAQSDETSPSLAFRVDVDAPRPYEKVFESGLDLVRWQNERRVSRALLDRLIEEARANAIEALAADGYFSAHVTSDVVMEAADRALVRLKVELGPRTHVRGLDLRFSGAALTDKEGRSRIAAVRQNWSLVPGEPFQQKAWDSAKVSALSRLSRGRYAAASIGRSEARVNPAAAAADLSVDFDSGPIFHAGRPEVTGLKRYPPSVVRNMNPFQRGEPYDAVKLDLFQRRLLETGYFNAVQLTIDPDPDQSAAAPLHVSVIEARSQRIDTSVLYNTDIGPGVSVDYSNADMFDGAWRFRSQLKLNAKEQNAGLTLDTPPRPGGVWNTYSARFDRSDIENQISRELVVGYAHNWGLQRLPSQVELSAHYERLSVAGAGSEDNRALFAGYRKTFRTTEELVSPREGLIGTFEAGFSIPGASTREFARTRALLNWLIPAGPKNDILLRGEVGIVLASSREGIPSSFLFRTGGSETIRGYAYQSLGVPKGDAIVGGRYLVRATAEYTRWITGTIGAAAFVDAGDAFDRTRDFDVAVGYGIGVRWRSPVGPFRADVAYGARVHKIRLHFSVGYTF